MHPQQAVEFEWDDAGQDNGNVAHLMRRQIREWEVEQIFLNEPEWRRNKRRGSGDWLMIGRTNAGRGLAVVVQFFVRERVLRAVTGWETNPRRRR